MKLYCFKTMLCSVLHNLLGHPVSTNSRHICNLLTLLKCVSLVPPACIAKVLFLILYRSSILQRKIIQALLFWQDFFLESTKNKLNSMSIAKPTGRFSCRWKWPRKRSKLGSILILSLNVVSSPFHSKFQPFS